ncbi:mRNA decapping complex subunit 2 [Colletotrichum sp. SAR11_240]|nr:mRNA decapping complex subunit 2 [Colletotrichum sp. SAR11_240]
MAEEKMQLEDWLDDLCVRFIINLPEEDLSSVARICFQIEEAQWFYEDFVRPLDPTLPSMTLRSFSLRIFQHCPLLAPFSVENHTKAFEEFLQYKTRVPVRGAILLNEAMDSTILVKGWKKGANWSFPRGKINKDEDDLECAIREVYEETGYDLHAAGLVPENRDVKYIEVTMREQQLRLYVFRNVPMDTHFQPRTRKEISKIQWYKLSELPAFRKKGAQNQNDAAAAANANKFYMVAPFLVPLKKWVVQQKKRDAVKGPNDAQFQPHPLHDELVTEDDVWQTEPVTDASTRTPALDTLEGATMELQRLLKVQPAAAQSTSVPISSESGGDKGASLLAILQAKNQAAVKAAPAAPVPHTPLDHTIGEVPQPRSPHGQHHPQQRVPLASYQHPPGFPVAPDGTPQQWAFSQQGNAEGMAHQAMSQRGQQLVDPAHRSALLNMFKKPETSSPPANQPAELPATTASAALLKGISTTRGDNQDIPSPVFQNRSTQPVSSSPLSRPPQGPADLATQMSSHNLSLHSQQIGGTEYRSPHSTSGYNPRIMETRSVYNQGAINQLAVLNNSPQSHSSHVSQHMESANKPIGLRSPAMATLLGAAGADKPTSLASPPAASALPAPAALQRKPEMSTEQRQKLLSLFGKPQSPSPACEDGVYASISSFGRRIDLLVNVAGVMDSFSSVDGVTNAEWDRVMAVNLTVPVKMMRSVLPFMKEKRTGAIVNVSSTAGLSGAVAGIAYTCSKHGLIGATKNVAWRFRKEGIRCNAVLPGAIDSRIGKAIATGHGDEFDVEAYAQVEPVHALQTHASGSTPDITPLEVAQAVIYLASDQARTINGVSLPIDQAWGVV